MKKIVLGLMVMMVVFFGVKAYASGRSERNEKLKEQDKNAYYLGDNKDIKFTKKNMHEDFKENTDLYKTLYGYIVPELESRLSTITPEEMEVVDEELNY
jgi:hypothetical protein